MQLNYELIHDILKFCEEKLPRTSDNGVSLSVGFTLSIEPGNKEGSEDPRFYKNQEHFTKYSWADICYHVFMLKCDNCLNEKLVDTDYYKDIIFTSLTMKGHELLAVLEDRDTPRQYFFK